MTVRSDHRRPIWRARGIDTTSGGLQCQKMTRARGRPPKDRTPPPHDGASPSSSSSYVSPTEELLAGVVDGEGLHVTRYDPRAGEWHYCGTYPADVVRAMGLAEFAKARGGGGKYRARVRRRDGTYARSLVFTLEGSPRPWDEPAAAAPVSSSSSSSSSSSREIPAWVEKLVFPILVAAGTAIADRMLKGPQADPLLLELVKRLASSSSGTDAVELHKLIAEAETRGERRGRELGELTAQVESAAETDHAGGVVGAIERGLPKVVDVLNRKLELDEMRLTQPPVTTVPPPADGVSSSDDAPPGASAAEPPPTPSADPLVAFLQSVPMVARSFLLRAAKDDEEPAVYAGLVLAKLDELTYKRMPAFVARPDFVDVFVTVWPAFGEYRQWVGELTDALRESLEAAASEEADAQPKAAS